MPTPDRGMHMEMCSTRSTGPSGMLLIRENQRVDSSCVSLPQANSHAGAPGQVYLCIPSLMDESAAAICSAVGQLENAIAPSWDARSDGCVDVLENDVQAGRSLFMYHTARVFNPTGRFSAVGVMSSCGLPRSTCMPCL